MSDIQDTGAIDWFLIEAPDRQVNGELVAPLLDLVDRRLIRILDVLVLVKRGEGDFDALTTSDLDPDTGRRPRRAGRRIVGLAVRRGCRRSGSADATELPRPDHRLREPVVAPVRGRRSQSRRPARGPGPHPHSGHRGRARLARVLNERNRHARTYSWRRPYRRGGRHGHGRQQPGLAPPGQSLVAERSIAYEQPQPQYAQPQPQYAQPQYAQPQYAAPAPAPARRRGPRRHVHQAARSSPRSRTKASSPRRSSPPRRQRSSPPERAGARREEPDQPMAPRDAGRPASRGAGWWATHASSAGHLAAQSPVTMS